MNPILPPRPSPLSSAVDTARRFNERQHNTITDNKTRYKIRRDSFATPNQMRMYGLSSGKAVVDYIDTPNVGIVTHG